MGYVANVRLERYVNTIATMDRAGVMTDFQAKMLLKAANTST